MVITLKRTLTTNQASNKLNPFNHWFLFRFSWLASNVRVSSEHDQDDLNCCTCSVDYWSTFDCEDSVVEQTKWQMHVTCSGSNRESFDAVLDPIIRRWISAAVTGYHTDNRQQKGYNGRAAHRSGSHVCQSSPRFRSRDHQHHQTRAGQGTKEA